ncbi:ABC transporter ATP-binding protein [Bradyrhizobium barranii subsp. apii]|uniref:ABC transporter ATP-binding protein n=1 Tax=Bradyrhizobium barranii subsp. apii TaxID=2819348 RepID=A0A8T5V247_9BRAD|nr:ABC transporter ATP-binding protein [Bradyrhizobium barranii]UPT86965.1 ABC transporter ATP-binding protein [Bradyrhizobium barranii subsp. apii]
MCISGGYEAPLLSAEGICAGYGRSRVLFDLSFAVAPGQIVGILGRNGAGKTTLLQTLMGEISLTAGRIHFSGQDFTSLDSAERAKLGLGYVPQDAPVFLRLSVQENLLAGALNSGTVDEVESVLELFPKLRARLGQAAGTLSGGERKMLGICRALLGRPKLLMLDEPTEGVWIGVVEEIAERLAELATRMAILIVEQNLGLALRVAQHVAVMDRGHFALSGKPAEIQSHPQFLRLLAP